MKKVKETALYILENILEKEEILSVEIEETEEGLVLRITTEKSAIGKLIGKEGRTIKSIRNLLKIVSFRETGKKLIVDVVKN